MRISGKDGRTIGKLTTDDRVFHKRVRGSKHMLREPIGWSIDSDVIYILEKLGCSEIEIFDVESGITYTVDFTEFLAIAIPINRGYGEQLALPLTYWQYEKTGA